MQERNEWKLAEPHLVKHPQMHIVGVSSSQTMEEMAAIPAQWDLFWQEFEGLPNHPREAEVATLGVRYQGKVMRCVSGMQASRSSSSSVRTMTGSARRTASCLQTRVTLLPSCFSALFPLRVRQWFISQRRRPVNFQDFDGECWWILHRFAGTLPSLSMRRRRAIRVAHVEYSWNFGQERAAAIRYVEKARTLRRDGEGHVPKTARWHKAWQETETLIRISFVTEGSNSLETPQSIYTLLSALCLQTEDDELQLLPAVYERRQKS